MTARSAPTNSLASHTPPPFKAAAFIFDMDGLLLDSEAPAVRLWVCSARSFGYEIPESVPIATIGLNEADTRALIMNFCGKTFPYDAVRDRLEELYLEEVESRGVARKAGVSSLLAALDAAALPRALATSSPRDAALYKLERSGLAGVFTTLVCGDQVARGKPAPDIFLAASDCLGVPPDRCIGFEDSPAGLKALAAARIRSVFIRDLIEPPPEVAATIWKRYDRLDQAIELI